MTKPTRPGATQTAQAPALSAEIRQKIATWNQYREWLEQGRKLEMDLRKELAALLVPNPKEGTNVIDGQGFRVVLNHKINRRLDKTTLDAIMPQMPEDARVIGTLIRYEPTFNLAYYRTLPEQVRKTFEQTLEISEGSPELEIVLSEPAENRMAAQDIGAQMYAPEVAAAAANTPEAKIMLARKRATGKTPPKTGKGLARFTTKTKQSKKGKK